MPVVSAVWNDQVCVASWLPPLVATPESVAVMKALFGRVAVGVKVIVLASVDSVVVPLIAVAPFAAARE